MADGTSTAADVSPPARTIDGAIEDRIRAHFVELIDWSDPEQALDTAGTALAEVAADSGLLREAVDGLSIERFEASLSVRGAYWFRLAMSDEVGPSVWIRFCPTGSVAPRHSHRSDILALVVAGTFKQTLIGRGGGVGSPDHPIELFVRHERPGQVFALDTRQEHETSSTAGSIMLAAMPAAAAVGHIGAPSDESEEFEAKVEVALRRLRREAKAIFAGQG
ncbi:MAG: hypothetical protein ACTHNP_02190 [Solirubrobacterales bacterium]